MICNINRVYSKQYFHPKFITLKTEHKWGIVIGVLNTVWLFGEYFAGLHGKNVTLYSTVTNFALVIPLVCTLIALYQIKKNEFNGTISFAEAFKPGLAMSTIAAVVSAFGVFLYFKFNTGFTNFMIDVSKQNAIKNGESIEKAADLAKMYYSINSYIVQSFISAIGFGTMLSAVIALVIRNKK
jgi:hypothetical protein